MSEQPVASASRRTPVVLLTLICAAYSVWVLSLPLFPTQDGPMHLYLTHVFESVLRQPDGFYGHFYFVRHLLPPYALYYYALMLLSSVVPLLLADKLIVCAYFFLAAFGFRFLARAIGPDGDTAALLSTSLLLSWPLGMGFLNFCLASALALWALGLWCRFAGRAGLVGRIGFVLLCYVIMLTHPVPLLFVLGFAAFETGIRLWRTRSLRGCVSDGLTLLAAAGTLVYVRLFTASGVTRQVHGAEDQSWHTKVTMLKGYALLHSLVAFAGRSPLDTLYRLLFYALLAGAFAVALQRLRRARQVGLWTLAETWTVAAVLFLLAFPFIPGDLNHSAYFSARLVVYIWVAALAAAAGARLANPRLSRLLALAAVMTTGWTLLLTEHRIRPIARDLAALETMPPLPPGRVGLLLQDPAYQAPTTVTYDPYFWSGARLFRRSDAVLWNTPWLDLPILPLAARATLPTDRLSPSELESPKMLRRAMSSASDAERAAILADQDFTLVSAGPHPAKTRLAGLFADPLLRTASGLPEWTCQPASTSFLCLPPRRP